MLGPATAALGAAALSAIGPPAGKALLDKIDPRLLAGATSSLARLLGRSRIATDGSDS